MHTLEVFILTYNRSGYLRESIESVLASSFKDFTLTVVDNCSTDDTKEVVDSFDDPRIKYHKHPENIGGINNINSAIRMSTADYVVLFHDDDKMTPKMLEEEYNFLEAHEDAGCVSSTATDFHDDGSIDEAVSAFDGEYKIFKGRQLFDAYFAEGTHTVCPSIMYRREVLHSHDLIFDPAVGPCCDIKLLFDIERYGFGVAVINKVLMLTRRHGAQDSTMNYIPMHIELYDYLNNDPYYGPMLEEKRQWRDAKYHDFSKALASLEIKGEQDRTVLRGLEKKLRSSCGGKAGDKCRYSVTVFAAKCFPGLMRKIYYKYKGGAS